MCRRVGGTFLSEEQGDYNSHQLLMRLMLMPFWIGKIALEHFWMFVVRTFANSWNITIWVLHMFVFAPCRARSRHLKRCQMGLLCGREEWSATDTSVWQKVGRVNIKDYSIYAVMSNGVFADFQIMRIFNGDIFFLYSTGIGTGFDTGTTTATIIA